MATMVEKIVDTGGSGDYTSLAAWESAMNTSYPNLVTSDVYLVARCKCTTGAANTTQTTIDTFTTDPTHYVKIYADRSDGYRHSGVYDSSKFRIEYTATSWLGAIHIQVLYVYIDGIQIYLYDPLAGTNQGAITVYYNNSSSRTYISNCLIILAQGSSKTSGGTYGISVVNSFYQNLSVWNNIVYFDGTKYALSYGIGDGHNSDTPHYSYIYNNTCVGQNYGFKSSSSTTNVILKNNISYNNGDNYNGTFSTSSTNNLSGPSQTDAPGSNPRNAVTVTFVDPTNNNYHLASTDTGAKGYGADLSGDSYLAFSDDIDGESRGSTWDIGADQYVAAGGGSSLPIFMDYYRRRRVT